MSKLDVKLLKIPYIIVLCSSYIGLYSLFWKKIKIFWRLRVKLGYMHEKINSLMSLTLIDRVLD